MAHLAKMLFAGGQEVRMRRRIEERIKHGFVGLKTIVIALFVFSGVRQRMQSISVQRQQPVANNLVENWQLK